VIQTGRNMVYCHGLLNKRLRKYFILPYFILKKSYFNYEWCIRTCLQIGRVYYVLSFWLLMHAFLFRIFSKDAASDSKVLRYKYLQISPDHCYSIFYLINSFNFWAFVNVTHTYLTIRNILLKKLYWSSRVFLLYAV